MGAQISSVPTDDRAIAHVLNRIGFGARPGDVEKVKTGGLQRYIEEQLHPDRIADAGMSARLGGLKTLAMSSREIAETYEIPQIQAREGKKAGRGAGERCERRRGRHHDARRASAGARPAAAESQPGRRRAVGTEDSARGLQRAAAPGSAHRLLVQSLQRRRPEGTRSLH